MNDRIAAVEAWEALDSRGRPTVGCCVRTVGGASGTATVPSGASTGRHEARELRDGGERHDGFGVRTAVANVMGPLADVVRGTEVTDQVGIDERLRAADGTNDLGRFGANAVLAVSVAAAVAAAAYRELPLYSAAAVDRPGLLPRPMVNIVSGGAHAAAAIDIQDVLAMPIAATTFGDAMDVVAAVRRHTSAAAQARGFPVALVADEGGLGLPLTDNAAALALVTEGIERAGFVPGVDVALAVDVAATQLGDADGYRLAAERRELSSAELVDEMVSWCARYPIVSIEDPLGEDDWTGWAELTRRLPHVQIVGDDLFVTNPRRVARGIADGVANAVLVKPNQIGTLTAALEVVRMAQRAGYATVLSARSGETEDSWLSDLAVAWRVGQLKVGSTMRSERTAKWNRLLRLAAQPRADIDAELPPWRSLAPPRRDPVDI